MVLCRADNPSHKTALVFYLLKKPEINKSIVFVRKRERLHELVTWLRDAGISYGYLEGKLAQLKSLMRLSNGGHSQWPIQRDGSPTDIADRKLDIDDISHVIHFDLPSTPEAHLHRMGRTARAGRKGCAISLVEAHDYLLLPVKLVVFLINC
ncbi:DNA/RNA helicase, superfamily II [secondary endosymbiont of Ctenarytaina eucalypti]|uniref:DNA/RNA helicase, superfamily II n=1 Tax=secondary endosymbiont of Ctenarytaina eucalypti TaxID=1199245 RepID=J3TF89_9ENTR|nr:DNA/RNA helicase, superfamily II [secondary endosymbiont of Ctenarytaina eucalypti]